MIDVTDTRISVSTELKDHYQKIIQKRDEILDSEMAEDKDVAAILRVTTDILKEFVKLQETAYNAEKFAVLQQIIIDTLKEESPTLQNKVLRRFEQRIEELAQL